MSGGPDQLAHACVADHVHHMRNSDRAYAPFAAEVKLLCYPDCVIDWPPTTMPLGSSNISAMLTTTASTRDDLPPALPIRCHVARLPTNCLTLASRGC